MVAPGPNKAIGYGPVNGRPDYIRNAVMHSLQRLKTDYIDLYTTARVDPNVPIEDTVGGLADLIQKGVVVILVYPKLRQLLYARLPAYIPSRLCK